MPLHQKLGQRSLQVNEQKVHELHLSTVAIVEHTLHSRGKLVHYLRRDSKLPRPTTVKVMLDEQGTSERLPTSTLDGLGWVSEFGA